MLITLQLLYYVGQSPLPTGRPSIFPSPDSSPFASPKQKGKTLGGSGRSESHPKSEEQRDSSEEENGTATDDGTATEESDSELQSTKSRRNVNPKGKKKETGQSSKTPAIEKLPMAQTDSEDDMPARSRETAPCKRKLDDDGDKSDDGGGRPSETAKASGLESKAPGWHGPRKAATKKKKF